MAAPLQIIVVGAGIGGLAAATALRRNGHQVTIYERSQFKQEHGAAITMTPNATGAMASLGIDMAEYGGVQCRSFTFWDCDKLIKTVDMLADAPHWQEKYYMMHRVDLHRALKEAALDPNGKGPASVLKLGAKVVRVDPDQGMVEFEDGTCQFADVVIGADGLSSASRAAISDAKPFATERSSYRMTFDRDELLKVPELKDFVNSDGEMRMMSAYKKSLVAYPGRSNKVLSVALVHPAEESPQGAHDFNHSGDKETMLRVAADFGPTAHALLSRVDDDSLKFWKIHDMKTLENWTRGRLALLGDAAHPFMPYQGQGGAMAIESAITIGQVLAAGVSRDEVAERLRLYQMIRQPRVKAILDRTRLSGRTPKRYMDGILRSVGNMRNHFPHNEPHNSAQEYRQFLWSQSPRTKLSMPVTFGPSPSTRQTADGVARASQETTYRTTSVHFNTSGTLLQTMLPSRSISFRNAGDTVVPAILMVQEVSNPAAGVALRTLGLYVPDVRYTKTDGSIYEGTYPVVIFNDMPEAVVSDREELGLPVRYSTVDVQANTEQGTISIKAQLRGVTFANIEISHLVEAKEVKLPHVSRDSLITHRYLPAVAAGAKPLVEQVLSIPPSSSAVAKSTSVGEARLEWQAHSVQTLPTLNHVVKRLAELPVFKVTAAEVVEHAGAPDYDGAVVIE